MGESKNFTENGVFNIADRSALEDALLSDDPFKRLCARSADAGWMSRMQYWLNAEARAGTDVATLASAVMFIQMSILASLLAQITKDGEDDLAGTFAERMREDLPIAVRNIRAAISKRKAAR